MDMFRKPACRLAWAVALAMLVAGASNGADRAPAFELSRFDSSLRYSSQELAGRVVLLTFWASWCVPPGFDQLAELERELGPRGLSVVSINVDEDEASARVLLGTHSVFATNLHDGGGRTPRAFGVRRMPASYLVGCDGTIRARHAGERMPGIEALRMAIGELLAEGCDRLQLIRLFRAARRLYKGDLRVLDRAFNAVLREFLGLGPFRF